MKTADVIFDLHVQSEELGVINKLSAGNIHLLLMLLIFKQMKV